jgi:methyl-accepting chemotaxis protein
MRTDSRFLVEDKENYLRASEKSGTDRKTVEKIGELSTTVLLQKVENAAIDAVLRGETGNKFVVDYRGVEVLSAYAPLDIPNVNWAIIAKIDKKEAFAPIEKLYIDSIFVLIFAGVLVTITSFLISKSISDPIVRLKETANDIARGKMNTKMSVFRKDEIGDLARSLDDMRYSLKMMIEEYEKEKKVGRQVKDEPDAS